MNDHDDLERLLRVGLARTADERPPSGQLASVRARIAETRQRPAWRPSLAGGRSVGRAGPGYVWLFALLALLVAASLAALVVTGSRPRLPLNVVVPPVGPSLTPTPTIGVGEVALEPTWEATGPNPNALILNLVVAPDSRIWVFSNEDAFWIFSPAGRFEGTWAMPHGPAPVNPYASPASGGQTYCFSNMCSSGPLAFGPDGGFWVENRVDRRIDHFDRDRRLVGSIAATAYGEDGQRRSVRALDVDAAGDLYVDNGFRILVFDPTGRLLKTFTVRDAAGRTLSAQTDGYARTMSVQADGSVLVASATYGSPPSLEVYGPDPSVRRTIDLSPVDRAIGSPPSIEFGSGGWDLQADGGLSADGQGDVYFGAVAGPPYVVKVTPSGDLVHAWRLPSVVQIAVDPTGDAVYAIPDGLPSLRKYDLTGP